MRGGVRVIVMVVVAKSFHLPLICFLPCGKSWRRVCAVSRHSAELSDMFDSAVMSGVTVSV